MRIERRKKLVRTALGPLGRTAVGSTNDRGANHSETKPVQAADTETLQGFAADHADWKVGSKPMVRQPFEALRRAYDTVRQSGMQACRAKLTGPAGVAILTAENWSSVAQW